MRSFAMLGIGLLDGRPATTHWRYTDVLARLYPTIDVRSDVLYVDDGQVLTSAGTAAALRVHVRRAVTTSPLAYRRLFARS